METHSFRSISSDSLLRKLGEITVFYAVNLARSQRYSLHEKCSYSELFWSVFSRIRAEYRPEKLRIRTLFIRSDCKQVILREKLTPSQTIYDSFTKRRISLSNFQGLPSKHNNLVSCLGSRRRKYHGYDVMMSLKFLSS